MKGLTVRALIILAGASGASSPVVTQSRLVDSARAGTARYQDQAAAIAEGYRRIGPDFPSMGEHWVNAALLVAGSLDPARPTVLEYATIAGRPTLVGVAYAVMVTDTTLPEGLAVPPEAWHTHGGSVNEESFVLSHEEAAAHRHAQPTGGGPRIAVVHAWIWLHNPAGEFATDNWALPFARLGLVPRTQVSPAAGRAASLAAEGLDYFTALVGIVGRADTAERTRLVSPLLAARESVMARLGVTTGTGAVTEAQLTDLERIWTNAWNTVLGLASPDVRKRLADLSGP